MGNAGAMQELPGACDREEHADLVPVDGGELAAGHNYQYRLVLHARKATLHFLALRCERARCIHDA